MKRLLLFVALPIAALAADSKPAAEVLLFNGESLAGWKQTAFDTQKEVKVEPNFRDGRAAIVIPATDYLCGINWQDESRLPRTNYEISLEAMRVEGSDFFCGLTFPVARSACTLIVGGWGGMLVGLSSVDGNDASENETTTGLEFKKDRWYRIRVRVTDEKIEAWIDQERFIDLETTNRRISLRYGDIKLSLPLGIATYQTKAAIRDIQLRRL
ncbi:MAG: DUF1080 domain-containing protein [Verrucomicrobia bacterium]|nr:DUF1080 domain-containing protein [Verrucomicrobiota bacterium]